MRYVLGGALLLAAFGIVLPLVIDIRALIRADDGDGSYLTVMLVGWTVLYVIAAGVAVWDTVRMVRRHDLDGLRRAALFTKLAGIPFFVMNFVILGFIVQSMVFFGLGVILAPFFVTWTYLVMLPTSVYGIGCLVALRRVPAVSPRFFAGHLVLHLLFVVDILSSLLVSGRARRVLLHGPPPPELLR